MADFLTTLIQFIKGYDRVEMADFLTTLDPVHQRL